MTEPETPSQALARIAEETRQLTAEHAAASTDLVAANVPADVVKAQMADRRSALMHKRIELEDARKAMEAEMRAKMDAAMAILAPLKKEVDQLEEGIWTVNLYLGRDQQIEPLRGGEPAPAETPIHIRQLVLSMDEETAINAASGGIDHMDVEKFDRWLLADPKHLDQILPEAKGVVVLVPRRRGRDYGDPWANIKRNQENEKSYWLVRNGERLYRMDTDFTVGKTILPKRTEFLDLFFQSTHNWETGKTERVEMEPGSQAWMRAEEAQGARQRHYMRSALILQGLLDHTSVFEPKPAYHVSTINPSSYEAGHVVLITDAEEDRQLTTGREPFYDWLKRLNKQLRPGMRIIGAFNVDAFRTETVDGTRYSRHVRISPGTAGSPASNVIHYLDGRRDGGLVFKYERGEIWTPEDGYRASAKRASCVVHTDDKFILPFDLVTVEEMRTYLEARLERHAYEDMFPLLKAAIALKQAEEAEEAPMRQLIVGQLVAAGASHTDAELKMPSLVDWWKLANKWHRPLIADDPATTAKAVKGIVAEYRARQQAISDEGSDATLVDLYRTKFPDALLVAQRRDGKWMVFTRQDGADAYGNAVAPSAWVTEWTFPRSGLGEGDIREWILPGVRPVRWRSVWEHEDWATWDRSASLSDHLSGPEIETLAAQAKQHAAEKYGDENEILGVTYQIAEPGDIEQSMIKVWLLPISDDDRSYPVKYARTWWKRTTGGGVRAEHGSYTTSQSYSGEQLFGRYKHNGKMQGPGLIEVDDEVRAKLDARIAESAARRDAKRVEWQAIVALEDSVVAEWRRRKVAREHEKFMDDFRDESLWPAYEAKLDIRYPHGTSYINQDSKMLQMFRTLLDAGMQVVGQTVDGLSVDYLVLTGKKFKVPADIADIVVTGPKHDIEQE